MTTVEMARALGLKPSHMVQIEHGRRVQLSPPADIAAQLAERGFAGDPENRTEIIETPVAIPDGFAERLDRALGGLTPDERATLDAGIAGRPLVPPYPTAAEMDRMRALIKGGRR
jgi:transcriptional regulator with XRE-family HTH domain